MFLHAYRLFLFLFPSYPMFLPARLCYVFLRGPKIIFSGSWPAHMPGKRLYSNKGKFFRKFTIKKEESGKRYRKKYIVFKNFKA
ncbi:MAG TPA: hypothetical protein DEA44_09280 [Firmicutes bacterium]|nr:hypothetical protein [Bacillota bacterium]